MFHSFLCMIGDLTDMSFPFVYYYGSVCGGIMTMEGNREISVVGSRWATYVLLLLFTTCLYRFVLFCFV